MEVEEIISTMPIWPVFGKMRLSAELTWHWMAGLAARGTRRCACEPFRQRRCILADTRADRHQLAPWPERQLSRRLKLKKNLAVHGFARDWTIKSAVPKHKHSLPHPRAL